jgi:hypothetical protein
MHLPAPHDARFDACNRPDTQEAPAYTLETIKRVWFKAGDQEGELRADVEIALSDRCIAIKVENNPQWRSCYVLGKAQVKDNDGHYIVKIMPGTKANPERPRERVWFISREAIRCQRWQLEGASATAPCGAAKRQFC